MIDFLEDEGLVLDWAKDGISGMHLALTQPFDLIILDLMLPGMNGLKLCQSLRDQGIQLPILILTALDELSDKVRGFQCGADDYLTKPFELKELLYRIKALTRRYQTSAPLLTIGDLTMNLGTRKVTREGRELQLNKVCFQLLEALMRAAPNAVSREVLSRLIWNDQPPFSDALKTHIYDLRQVIDRPFQVPMIITVRGYGFQLNTPP